MDDFWAIILAAGESRRMGSPKMLLPFNGSTMIETVIRNVSGSVVKNILVVLGSDKEKIEALIKKPVQYCYNNNYKEGMLSSVVTGFSNLPSSFKAALIFQGDQPLITAASINLVTEAFLSSGNGLVIPVYNKRRGHPLLIDSKYRNEIGRLAPEKGLRSLTSKFADDVLEIETDEPGILKDFDTYDDYKEYNKMQ